MQASKEDFPHQAVTIANPPEISNNIFLAAISAFIIINAKNPEKTIETICNVFADATFSECKLNQIIEELKSSMENEKQAFSPLLTDLVAAKLNARLADYIKNHPAEFVLGYANRKAMLEDATSLINGCKKYQKPHIQAFSSLSGIPILTYEDFENVENNLLECSYRPHEKDPALAQPIMLAAENESKEKYACIVDVSLVDAKIWVHSISENILLISKSLKDEDKESENKRDLIDYSQKRKEKILNNMKTIFNYHSIFSLLKINALEMASIEKCLRDLPIGFIEKMNEWHHLEKIRWTYRQILTNNFYLVSKEDFLFNRRLKKKYAVGVYISQNSLICSYYDALSKSEEPEICFKEIPLLKFEELIVKKRRSNPSFIGMQISNWKKKHQIDLDEIAAYTDIIVELINPRYKEMIIKPISRGLLKTWGQHSVKYKVASMSSIAAGTAGGFFIGGGLGAFIGCVMTGLSFIMHHMVSNEHAKFFESILDQCNGLVIKRRYFDALELLENELQKDFFDKFETLLTNEHHAMVDFFKGFCEQNLENYSSSKYYYNNVFKRLNKKQNDSDIFLFSIMQILALESHKKITLTDEERNVFISFIPMEYLEHLHYTILRKINEFFEIFDKNFKAIKNDPKRYEGFIERILTEERGFLIRNFQAGMGARTEICLHFFQGVTLIYCYASKKDIHEEIITHLENTHEIYEITDDPHDVRLLIFAFMKFNLCGILLSKLHAMYPEQYKNFDVDMIENFILFSYAAYKEEINKFSKKYNFFKCAHEYFINLEKLYSNGMKESRYSENETPLFNLRRTIEQYHNFREIRAINSQLRLG